MWWLALLACSSQEVLDAHVIPAPSVMTTEAGRFVLSDGAVLAVSPGAEAVGEVLAAQLRPATGFALAVTTEAPGRGDIALVLDPTLDLGQEGYTLDVDRTSVTVRAATPAGLFHGGQTLRQLLPPGILGSTVANVDWEVPRVHIEDQPRFAWRGSMLDIARHFFGPDDLKRHIDRMALYKLNRLHLHLTDDQGWRIEIQSWPKLTEIGGSTQVGGGPGGFLTQAEYADLVAYAAERHIVVVPEIDMPGHIHAALASYGELNPDGQAPELYTGTNVGFSSLWLDGDITYEFVGDVLSEVAALTPGPYLHVGGDETDATSPEDYVAFMQWVQGEVASHDKTLVAWDEVATAELQPPFVGQYWVGEARAAEVAAAGGQVISSPAEFAYLDMMYALDTGVGTLWAGLSPVDEAYSWDPVPTGVPEERVLGVEAPLWTESTDTWDDVDLLVWPRLAGHAELGWSAPKQLGWEGYRVRLAHHGPRMEALGIGFYRSEKVDWVTP